MQMQISCNRPNNLELCSICEMNINVPSAELRPLASLQEQIQKWVALYSISLRTVALRTQCANMCSTYYREEKLQPKYSSIYIWVIIQSLPHTSALDDEGFRVVHGETVSWKVSEISERVCFCMRWYQQRRLFSMTGRPDGVRVKMECLISQLFFPPAGVSPAPRAHVDSIFDSHIALLSGLHLLSPNEW